MKKIKLKRVYDPVSKEDGARFLIDRLWPRGLKKEELIIDAWLKEVAPSNELRKWFSHDPSKWKQFQQKYLQELEANHKALAPILHELHKRNVTLLYSAKDEEHNNAVIVKNFLESMLSKI